MTSVQRRPFPSWRIRLSQTSLRDLIRQSTSSRRVCLTSPAQGVPQRLPSIAGMQAALHGERRERSLTRSVPVTPQPCYAPRRRRTCSARAIGCWSRMTTSFMGAYPDLKAAFMSPDRPAPASDYRPGTPPPALRLRDRGYCSLNHAIIVRRWTQQASEDTDVFVPRQTQGTRWEIVVVSILATDTHQRHLRRLGWSEPARLAGTSPW